MKEQDYGFQKSGVKAVACLSLCPGVSFIDLILQVQETKGQQSGGIIKGVVNTPWVKRYPALVYVDQVKGEFPPPKKNPFMGQKGMVFTPHILPVLKGSTVDFTNDDTVAHNVFSPPGCGNAL